MSVLTCACWHDKLTRPRGEEETLLQLMLERDGQVPGARDALREQEIASRQKREDRQTQLRDFEGALCS